MQGLLVSRNGQKGVIKLDVLSNLDCEAEELADLFEIMDDRCARITSPRSACVHNPPK